MTLLKRYIITFFKCSFSKFKIEEADVVHDLENPINLHFVEIINREPERGNTVRSLVNLKK